MCFLKLVLNKLKLMLWKLGFSFFKSSCSLKSILSKYMLKFSFSLSVRQSNIFILVLFKILYFLPFSVSLISRILLSFFDGCLYMSLFSSSLFNDMATLGNSFRSDRRWSTFFRCAQSREQETRRSGAFSIVRSAF